ncbi:hypothetical protein [Dyadobacter sediminis]|uniref:Uncharacterized protein n=1 Tax=Dyadobacter sediminis TaxID=1493691 RepID=A0A5R9K7F0_9BACT|nr:hypothetical protein [Dyadobacter sediminis]TLU89802.1 hypothetical protein FEM55_19905 [Dyadobacter sediminis]GGC12688.1 hypothetical protein GCM10011325_44430 [Dyadobacter sediminis]
MNQTFNIHRFTLMLRFDVAEKGKTYLFTAALLLALLVLLMLPVGLSTQYNNMKELLHILALFMIVLFGTSLYTSSAFTQYAAPSTGIAAIMVPASRIEKFLSALLLNLVFIIPFVIIFWKLHYGTIAYANAHLPAGGPKFNRIPEFVLQYAFQYYFLIHAFVFLGSLYFTKASYLKTAAIVIGSFLAIGLLHIGLGYYLTSFPSKLVAFPITGWSIWLYPDADAGRRVTEFYQVKLPENVYTFIQLFPAWIVLVLWFATYLRLREKEI